MNLLATYRAACRAARLDPEVGPTTLYQCVVATSEARKQRPVRRESNERVWWLCDWSPYSHAADPRDRPRRASSAVEQQALVNVAAAALRHRLCDAPPRPHAHLRPLREIFTQRGESSPHTAPHHRHSASRLSDG
ncbi:MAG: hypothetical protein SGJ24_04545 [Chloroflexota bacterium]|nr:hypothetical protein [Chloroflexota bacterium]